MHDALNGVDLLGASSPCAPRPVQQSGAEAADGEGNQKDGKRRVHGCDGSEDESTRWPDGGDAASAKVLVDQLVHKRGQEVS
jgi:hypothetical protein